MQIEASELPVNSEELNKVGMVIDKSYFTNDLSGYLFIEKITIINIYFFPFYLEARKAPCKKDLQRSGKLFLILHCIGYDLSKKRRARKRKQGIGKIK